MATRRSPIGVILAGGLGRRIGGSKATVKLRGRPLIEYPLAAVASVLDDVVVIAKADTELPELPRIAVWIEPDEPRHPVVGIAHALALAEGRPVLVCASDLPLVSPGLVERIAFARPAGAPAIVASHAGMVQPLLGCYRPAAAAGLSAAGLRPLRETVAAIGARLFEVEDPDELFNINSPDDLLQATAMIDQRMREARATRT